ncbi:MAG: CCA tRNA nucleotidyltransferase [Phycisphaerales bacterium]
MGQGANKADAATSRAAATQIVRTLRDAGFAALFAGGCVRDELLGLTPSDYDVATDAKPPELAKLFSRTAEVGAHFGVMLVRIGEAVIEVATFRADGSYSDKRRPDSVEFSSPLQDARRRDFTVNALYLDPTPKGDSAAAASRWTTENVTPATHICNGGVVIDYVGGLQDLPKKLLRAVGDPDARLAEDHLRALRAVRLAAKLGFGIEEKTQDAIRRHASSLSGISRERIGDEVRMMMERPSRATAIAQLRSLSLEDQVLGVSATRWQSVSGTVPNYKLLSGLPTGTTFGVCIAAWLLDLGLPLQSLSTEAQVAETLSTVRGMLCLSNAERDELASTLRDVPKLLSDWPSMSIAARKRLVAGPGYLGGISLLRGMNPSKATEIDTEVRKLAKDGVGIAPPAILTGDVLVEMGLRPGPAFKTILDRVYDAQLEGKIRDLQEARELVGQLRV